MNGTSKNTHNAVHNGSRYELELLENLHEKSHSEGLKIMLILWL